MNVSAIIITRGDREPELQAAIDSLESAEPPVDEIVIVWNGGRSQAEVAVERQDVFLETNEGVPAARNAGARVARGGLLLFLDDDAALATPNAVELIVASFQREAEQGALGLRLVDPETGVSLRRWLPRPRSSITSGGPATRFPGGASVINAAAFAEVGGFAGQFFYAHEETDISWRLIDAGYKIRYEPLVEVHHPVTATTRHPDSVAISSRNRVWLARRNLPWPLVPIYVAVWTLASLIRCRSVADLGAVSRGTIDGFAQSAGSRRAMGWGTVLRLTRLGHPPIF